MIFLRKPDNSMKERVYEMTDFAVLKNRKTNQVTETVDVKYRKRAWRYDALVGDETARAPSQLCCPGYAAIADNVSEATKFINDLKSTGLNKIYF